MVGNLSVGVGEPVFELFDGDQINLPDKVQWVLVNDDKC